MSLTGIVRKSISKSPVSYTSLNGAVGSGFLKILPHKKGTSEREGLVLPDSPIIPGCVVTLSSEHFIVFEAASDYVKNAPIRRTCSLVTCTGQYNIKRKPVVRDDFGSITGAGVEVVVASGVWGRLDTVGTDVGAHTVPVVKLDLTLSIAVSGLQLGDYVSIGGADYEFTYFAPKGTGAVAGRLEQVVG